MYSIRNRFPDTTPTPREDSKVNLSTYEPKTEANPLIGGHPDMPIVISDSSPDNSVGPSQRKQPRRMRMRPHRGGHWLFGGRDQVVQLTRPSEHKPPKCGHMHMLSDGNEIQRRAPGDESPEWDVADKKPHFGVPIDDVFNADATEDGYSSEKSTAASREQYWPSRD